MEGLDILPGLLIDSNVFVDYLRGRAEAVKFVDGITERIAISAITVAELYAGVREGEERRLLDSLVAGLDVIEVTKEIAAQGGLLLRGYMRSHGVGFADAVIAATATEAGFDLVTLNRKHFPMFPNLIVPYERS